MTTYSYPVKFMDLIVDPDRTPVVVEIPIGQNQLLDPIILWGTGLFATCAVILMIVIAV